VEAGDVLCRTIESARSGAVSTATPVTSRARRRAAWAWARSATRKATRCSQPPSESSMRIDRARRTSTRKTAGMHLRRPIRREARCGTQKAPSDRGARPGHECRFITAGAIPVKEHSIRQPGGHPEREQPVDLRQNGPELHVGHRVRNPPVPDRACSCLLPYLCSGRPAPDHNLGGRHRKRQCCCTGGD